MNTFRAASTRLLPQPSRGSQKLFKYPILVIVIIIVIIELIIYGVLRSGVRVYEYVQKICYCKKNKAMYHTLGNANSFAEYVHAAKDLDHMQGRNIWKFKESSFCYDVSLVKKSLNSLKTAQRSENEHQMSKVLLQIFHHVIKWFEQESLFNQTNYGTKFIVEDYLNVVEESIQQLGTTNNNDNRFQLRRAQSHSVIIKSKQKPKPQRMLERPLLVNSKPNNDIDNHNSNSTNDNRNTERNNNESTETRFHFNNGHINNTRMSIAQKLEFFTLLEQEFGQTALCLSGGATMTFYQFGVIRTLLRNNLLPHIISGTSGGSLVGSMIAVRTDEELHTFLTEDVYRLLPIKGGFNFCQLIQRFWQTRNVFDWHTWKDILRMELTKGDTTFLEAFQMTGRIFNVTAISESHSPVLLNYKTTPNVCIWSAVLASSSLHCFLPPSPLIQKQFFTDTKRENDDDEDEKHEYQRERNPNLTYFPVYTEPNNDSSHPCNYELVSFDSYGNLWYDGSTQFDVPKLRLLEEWNVRFTICVQCNIHVIVFYYNARGTANSPVHHIGNSELRGGFLSSFLEKTLKLEMKKWMTLLCDFDLVPQILGQDLRLTALQETRGTITINPRPIINDIFELMNDPTLLRTKRFFKHGMQITFPYLYMIEKRLRLQNLIGQCITQLKSGSQLQSQSL